MRFAEEQRRQLDEWNVAEQAKLVKRSDPTPSSSHPPSPPARLPSRHLRRFLHAGLTAAQLLGRRVVRRQRRAAQEKAMMDQMMQERIRAQAKEAQVRMKEEQEALVRAQKEIEEKNAALLAKKLAQAERNRIIKEASPATCPVLPRVLSCRPPECLPRVLAPSSELHFAAPRGDPPYATATARAAAGEAPRVGMRCQGRDVTSALAPALDRPRSTLVTRRSPLFRKTSATWCARRRSRSGGTSTSSR